ncbi:MAG TPA: pentapeptide repeat-containing protein [Pyrinomonadaceae bacterium]|nr:pentapeptide repeat-containing protein [Pyrinomonadaceae bacterium]
MSDSTASEPESDFVCSCQEWMRSACSGEPFYREYQGRRYCVLHLPETQKSVDFSKAIETKLAAKDFNFRGVWFPAELRLDNYEFLDNVDFSGTFFNSRVFITDTRFTIDANFSGATFAKEAYFTRSVFNAKASFQRTTFRDHAYFSAATFRAVLFFKDATFEASLDFAWATCLGPVNFSTITLKLWATFQNATFRDKAAFTNTSFNEADFRWTTFQSLGTFNNLRFKREADFTGSQFLGELDFNNVMFEATASFKSALFGDRVRFAGEERRPVFMKASALDLQFARTEKPDRVFFHTLCLHPHWFIHVDPRGFEFINVDWNNSGKAKLELELLKKKNVASPHRLLAIASRRLAANAEDNDRYREASHFRRMALDSERLATWCGFDFRKLNWWYWIASGYGERPFQALMVLMGILVLFGMLYTRIGFARWEPKLASEVDSIVAKPDEVGAPLNIKRALTYSGGVMTLQKPEPKPATVTAQALVLAETILGPVQAALLALALRRKFMR